MSQIDYVLPKLNWQRVVVNENNDPIVGLHETQKLIFGKNISPYCVDDYRVRKTVGDMLFKVSQSLPAEYKLAVIEGIRSLSMQNEHWDKKTIEFKKLHPEWSSEEIEYQVGLVVARPPTISKS